MPRLIWAQIEFQDYQMKCQENVQTAHGETMPEYMSDSMANYMSTGTSGKNFARKNAR